MAGLKQVYEKNYIDEKRSVAARPQARGPGAAAAPGWARAGALQAQNLSCPAPPHTQTAYPTSSCLAHMKDKSPKYNLSKLYIHTYDSLGEWSLATLAKM